MAMSYSLYDSVQLQLQFVFKVATINTCILAFYNHFYNFDLTGWS